MQILQIAPPWFSVPPPSYGGIEAVVAALSDGLVDAGHEVTLVASGGSTTRADLRIVYDVPPTADLGDPQVAVTHALAGYVGRHAFDVIHDHTDVGPAIAAVADGPPVVHTLHGAWNNHSSRLYAAVSDRVNLVAISHDQARRAPAGTRIASVVHNGIATETYEVGKGAGGYLAFVGRANPVKGPEAAIDVAERLGMPLRMAMKVNEANEHLYWQEVLLPRIEQADVDVLLQATHDQKVDLLGGAVATLCPIAWDEPFGLVMAEANATGTPVVAFARGAAPEVVAHGTSGILVPPGNLDALTAAVEEAAQLDRAACRRHVEEHFTTSVMVANYLDVYEQVASQGEVATTGRRHQ